MILSQTINHKRHWKKTLKKKNSKTVLKKNLPALQETCLIPGSRGSPGEDVATHSSILSWEILWTEEPGRLQSMGHKWVRHDLATTTARKMVFGFIDLIPAYGDMSLGNASVHRSKSRINNLHTIRSPLSWWVVDTPGLINSSLGTMELPFWLLRLIYVISWLHDSCQTLSTVKSRQDIGTRKGILLGRVCLFILEVKFPSPIHSSTPYSKSPWPELDFEPMPQMITDTREWYCHAWLRPSTVHSQD